MFAIWSYDLYPYFCAGKVEGEPDDKGYFKVPSYQTRIRPIAIVSDEVGEMLKKLEHTLRGIKQREVERIEKQGHEEIEKLIGFKIKLRNRGGDGSSG